MEAKEGATLREKRVDPDAVEEAKGHDPSNSSFEVFKGVEKKTPARRILAKTTTVLKILGLLFFLHQSTAPMIVGYTATIAPPILLLGSWKVFSKRTALLSGLALAFFIWWSTQLSADYMFWQTTRQLNVTRYLLCRQEAIWDLTHTVQDNICTLHVCSIRADHPEGDIREYCPEECQNIEDYWYDWFPYCPGTEYKPTILLAHDSTREVLQVVLGIREDLGGLEYRNRDIDTILNMPNPHFLQRLGAMLAFADGLTATGDHREHPGYYQMSLALAPFWQIFRDGFPLIGLGAYPAKFERVARHYANICATEGDMYERIQKVKPSLEDATVYLEDLNREWAACTKEECEGEEIGDLFSTQLGELTEALGELKKIVADLERGLESAIPPHKRRGGQSTIEHHDDIFNDEVIQ